MSNDMFSPHTETKKDSAEGDNLIVIPVIEERITVDKRREETATVTVKKSVTETTETVNTTLQSEIYNIEHVVINAYVDDEQLPVTRREGDTLIIPILKEIMVKRTVLVEEVRLTRKITQVMQPQEIILRAETVEVIRTPAVEK